MGISIKREETERLAREVASLTGVSLTEAVHEALERRLATLRVRKVDDLAVQAAKREALMAKLRAMRRPDGPSREEIDEEMYGPFGEPIG